jgi:GT2 family glycosyltransferase
MCSFEVMNSDLNVSARLPSAEVSRIPVSVIIPTWNRVDDLRRTLSIIFSCSPAPDEVIIHIDHGDEETEAFLQDLVYPVRILRSSVQRGPGGGRDFLLKEASHELVASFDDDSQPVDPDYFARLVEVFEKYPAAAVVGSKIFHRGEVIEERTHHDQYVTSFVGCGCAYRRSVYLQLRGYLELPVPYGVEESDLRFQLYRKNWKIVSSSRLRVLHDTELRHHASPRIVSNTIANSALLAYLHYPVSWLPVGAVQVLSVIGYAMRCGRLRGILTGIRMIPERLWRFRRFRDPLSWQQMRLFHQPVVAAARTRA